MRFLALLVIVSLLSAGCSVGVVSPSDPSSSALPVFVLDTPRMFVAAALIFAPSIFKSAGGSIFDDGTVASGVDGITPFYMSSP